MGGYGVTRSVTGAPEPTSTPATHQAVQGTTNIINQERGSQSSTTRIPNSSPKQHNRDPNSARAADSMCTVTDHSPNRSTHSTLGPMKRSWNQPHNHIGTVSQDRDRVSHTQAPWPTQVCRGLHGGAVTYSMHAGPRRTLLSTYTRVTYASLPARGVRRRGRPSTMARMNTRPGTDTRVTS